ncbi:serine/threonine protein kinase [Corynebacterium suranareeae]|uniref:non-specific serine/threonine protein kinase n=1 Tax=Corynebacterium suranareeae TaxID=2506452 RepID=A0A160PV21_9CORY|nr:Stk1 family PASTA domain-containing Ser/Thr kinase [Corynebacterium suranareeae]BAU96510.1 serine/threonine protein kinase [Corynebacterium suranareeae]
MANLKVGDVLEDRYRIETPIARGGMSTVYRCLDLRLGRSMALKVMEEDFVDDPIFRQRFRREARSMAQLNHPNLVNVYDFSATGGLVYLVMELITGGTLRELLAERGPMPPHAAVGVMRGMLTGLAAAHRAGMVHRDIKPDNVLINSDHQVKLSDFGLVRAAHAGQSQDNQIVGTVAYLSPEQVEGGEIGPASDVYSAGIVLFELLTGTTPFSGTDDLDHAYARLTEVVPAPSSLIDGVPSLIDELVATATSIDPEDRFDDSGEFLTALEDVAKELDLPAFRVPVPINSAANRANAQVPDSQPTDMFTTHIPKTTEADHTAVIPAANETSILPVQGAQPLPETAYAPELPPEAALHIEDQELTQPDEPDINPVSNRSKLKLTLWSIFVVIVIAAVAIGGWWFGSGRYGEIPQVLGMDEVQAVSVVEEAGFVAVSQPQYDNDVPTGSIIGTDPSFGERLPRGEDVSVLVSQGRPVVPDLSEDRSVSTVREELEQHTFVWVDGPGEYSDDVPEGQVVSLTPASGTQLNVGETVQIHLSRGPAPVEIPDVSGMGVDQATRVLERAGLTVERTEEGFDADTANGDVYATSPQVSTEVKRGTSVVLQVSNAISVPDVVGMTQDEATAALAEEGLVVASTSVIPGEAASSADTVVSVEPESGSRVDPAHPQVSLGLAGEIQVPSVVGRKVSDARSILEDAGLTLVTDADDDDRIYSQSPRARSDVSVGGEVTVRAF